MNKKLLGIGIFVSVFVIAIIGINSKALAAISSTADVSFVLTSPAEDGDVNHITITGINPDKYVNVDVENGSTSVVITATKTAGQTITLTGMGDPLPRDDSYNVTVTGTATNPIYTVNTVTNGQQETLDPDVTGDDVHSSGGNKTFLLTVSEDAKSSIAYTINVQVAEPEDDELSNLSISSGTLNPEFSPNINDYTARVSSRIESITVTPTANDNNAIITVNGEEVTSGEESGSIPLDSGTNIITVEVTAEDSSTSSYEIIVTKERLSSRVIGSYASGYRPEAPSTPLLTLTTITTPIVLPTSGTLLTDSLIQKMIKDLKFGMISNDVKVLQLFLIEQNKGPDSLALKNHGTTNNFGKLTKASLMEWQKANGLASDGIFGPKTRELIKSLGL